MTTTAATCTQPGCGGSIDDGYCTVCGMAAAPVPAPAPVPVTVSQGLGSLPSMSGSRGRAGSRGARAKWKSCSRRPAARCAWLASTGPEYMPLTNPATGEPLATAGTSGLAWWISRRCPPTIPRARSSPTRR